MTVTQLAVYHNSKSHFNTLAQQDISDVIQKRTTNDFQMLDVEITFHVIKVLDKSYLNMDFVFTLIKVCLH